MPHPVVVSSVLYSPYAGVKGGRPRQRLLLHGAVPGVCVLLLREPAVPVERAVVGRGLGRGVDGAGALVDGSAQRPGPAPVYSGERHVGVLVLNLHNRSAGPSSAAQTFTYFPLCLK